LDEAAPREGPLCAVLAGNAAFLIAAQAPLAQRQVTLRQRNLLWRNVDFFGAT
jgi:hypothetical protein